ncbi:MAG: S-layer protein [archaeon]|jgi:hypothetical protein
MKGLDIKRIAAIGLGAALVGSALAPAVMALPYSNLTTLKKENIIDATTGMPVVDIVVGSLGQAPDVVWAGNIAAKVAQMATLDVAGSGTKTVDITVGGTQTTTGSGNTDENYLSLATTGVEFNPIKADYSDSTKFVNQTGAKYRWGGTDYFINIDDNVEVISDATVQSTADGKLPGDVTASVARNAFTYNLRLGDGFYAMNSTQLDANSEVDVKIPILGSTYVLDEISSSGKTLVFFRDTTPTELKVGEAVTVDGVGSYAGKKLTIKLVNLVQVGTGTALFQPKWVLMDGETALKYVQKAPSYDLKDEFGSEYFTTSIYVSAAGQNLSDSSLTATVRMGNSRLEIRDNQVFPYSSADTTNPEWKAYITTAGGKVTNISIKNNWAYDQAKSSSSTQKLVLGAGESILMKDYAKFTFNGLQTKPMAKATVGGNNLTITDTKGILRTIPMVISLGSGTNEVTIDGKPFVIDVNTATNTARYWTISRSSSATTDPWGTTTAAPSGSTDVIYTAVDVNTDTAIGFTVDADWKNSTTGKVNYYLGADEAHGNFYLFLAVQRFDMDDDGDTISGTSAELAFDGTEVDQNLSNGITSYGGVRADLNYYLPDVTTYNVLTAEANNNTAAMGTTSESATGSAFRSPSEGDTYQYVAAFTFNEGSEGVTTTDINAFVMTSDSMLVDSSNNKTRATVFDNEVEYANWSLNEYTTAASTKLMKGVTNYGTDVSVAGGVATISMPNQARKVEAYVGSQDTVSSSVGGEKLLAVTVGTKKTTASGTEITVDSITGATAGKTIVPVGNIVKLDTAMANGKSIIVGGFMVNTAAKNLTVDGQTLESRLTAAGDYVSAVLADGKIVVAGWTAADTASAAQALIAALDAM